MDKSLLIIGGSNIDYIATSKDKILSGVSNIGKVNISFGGVARNICENLARLGNKIDFITTIGNDLYGNNLYKQLKDLNVNVIFPKVNLNSSSYLAINDNNHDLALAVCDNEIINYLDKEFLGNYNNLILSHEYIILDANLNSETIDYIFNLYFHKKIIVDAISPTKILKFKKHLSNIYLLKCNKFEARALVNDESSNASLVKKLLEYGVKNVVISFGASDIYYGSKDEIGIIKNELITDFINTTGCGDALTSGIIDHFIVLNQKLKDSIIFGNKLSKITLMSSSSTSKEIAKYAHL